MARKLIKKEVKKNVEIKKFIGKGRCSDLTHQGVGVVKIDYVPYFVNDLLPGEDAKIAFEKKSTNNFGYGDLIERFDDSPSRVTPICKNFLKCGGCDLMHMP